MVLVNWTRMSVSQRTIPYQLQLNTNQHPTPILAYPITSLLNYQMVLDSCWFLFVGARSWIYDTLASNFGLMDRSMRSARQQVVAQQLAEVIVMSFQI
jgi:hypothetical protein